MKPTDRQAAERAVAERVGTALRAQRKALGLTLAQVAKLSEVDVSQLSKIERGEVGTGNATLQRIARELGLTLADLFARAFPRHGRRAAPARSAAREIRSHPEQD